MKKSVKKAAAPKKSAVKTPTIDALPHVTLENLGTTPRIDTPVKKAPKTKTEKSKRVSLNPQPILDAKTEALKELGVELTWAGRKWKAKDREFTSLEMSKYSVDEFAKLFDAK
jgi:hypothetical protein